MIIAGFVFELIVCLPWQIAGEKGLMSEHAQECQRNFQGASC